MAVAPASMADKIIVLDCDDEEENSKPSCSNTNSSFQSHAKTVSTLKSKQPVPTHITKSPFASAKKDTHVLQAENKRLFAEFVDHCSSLTQDCPEVLTFLQNKYSRAAPDYVSSVAFRNTLGSCLTRAQANRSKTFVFINELCTVLMQHSAKRKMMVTKVETRPCTSTSSFVQSTTDTLKNNTKDGVNEGRVNPGGEDPQPSNSGQQEDGKNKQEDKDTEKRANRFSRKQLAYLENLLKAYNDEIRRLQQADLSLDDMESESSTYIQEHKLKRKMMKIYEKLCEIKGCSRLTGRVIEQRITYSGTRYPEINKKIERFINSAESQRDPPDYQDILQQVIRTNERHSLGLSRNQLNQIAKEAFGDVGTRMQDRRHLDLVYNFGSHLTDNYKPAADPAQSDPSLHRKLKSNREVALSRLEEVITKYAGRQEDVEERERAKRLEKNSKDTVVQKSEKEEEIKEVNGVTEHQEEEEEEEEEEEDESSDTDIEEELQASTQQDGADDEEDEDSKVEQACDVTNKDNQTDEKSGSFSAGEIESMKDEEQEPNGLAPLSDESNSQTSPLSEIPSPRHSPIPTETMQIQNDKLLSNGNLSGSEEPVGSSSHVSDRLQSDSKFSTEADSKAPFPLSPVVIVGTCDTQTATNGMSPPSSPRTRRGQKRKREEKTSRSIRDTKRSTNHDSEVDIPLDMGVFNCSSPQPREMVRAGTPPQEMVTSSQVTPPPKKNKVNVATQCDPEEIIVLSDSE